MSTLNILVIDNQREEREKGCTVIRTAGHYAAEAQSLHQALLFLRQFYEAKKISGKHFFSRWQLPRVKWNGVITALNYPSVLNEALDETSTEFSLNGMAIVVRCYRLGLPCVICADVCRHDSKWIQYVGRQLHTPVVADRKQAPDAWHRSLELLVSRINEKQQGEAWFNTLGSGLW